MNNGVFGQSGEIRTFARDIIPCTTVDLILHAGRYTVQCTGICSGGSKGRIRFCSLRERNRLDIRIRRGFSASFDDSDFGAARQFCQFGVRTIDILPSSALVKTVLHTGINLAKGTRVRAGGGKVCARRCCLGLSRSVRKGDIYIKTRHTGNRDLRGTVAGNCDAILFIYGVSGGEVVAIVGCYNNRGHILDNQSNLFCIAGTNGHVLADRDVNSISSVGNLSLGKIAAGNLTRHSAIRIFNSACKGTISDSSLTVFNHSAKSTTIDRAFVGNFTAKGTIGNYSICSVRHGIQEGATRD